MCKTCFGTLDVNILWLIGFSIIEIQTTRLVNTFLRVMFLYDLICINRVFFISRSVFQPITGQVIPFLILAFLILFRVLFVILLYSISCRSIWFFIIIIFICSIRNQHPIPPDRLELTFVSFQQRPCCFSSMQVNTL